MPVDIDVPLNDIDTRILQELSVDGRQHVSDIAKKCGVSRAYVARRLKKLLDQQTTRVVAYINPLALGYRMSVMIGLTVMLDRLHNVAERLSDLPNVQLVLITTGACDIVITVVIRELSDLSEVMTHDLGNIPGIISTEAWFITETKKISYAYLGQPDVIPGESEHTGAFSPAPVSHNLDLSIDEIDLAILQELEVDGRQTISSLALTLATSRAVIRTRLTHLINQQIVRIVAFTHPALLGYRNQAMIGIKTSPNQVENVLDKLTELDGVFWVARVAGRYDVMIWTMFFRPTELSRFLCDYLGSIPGIVSVDTMVGLKTTKIGFTGLASSHPTNQI